MRMVRIRNPRRPTRHRSAAVAAAGAAVAVPAIELRRLSHRRCEGGMVSSYLVIHTPDPEQEDVAHKPSDMVGLARAATAPRANPRWIKTWSPDLHDDRFFTLWEADNA